MTNEVLQQHLDAVAELIELQEKTVEKLEGLLIKEAEVTTRYTSLDATLKSVVAAQTHERLSTFLDEDSLAAQNPITGQEDMQWVQMQINQQIEESADFKAVHEQHQLALGEGNMVEAERQAAAQLLTAINVRLATETAIIKALGPQD